MRTERQRAGQKELEKDLEEMESQRAAEPPARLSELRQGLSSGLFQQPWGGKAVSR